MRDVRDARCGPRPAEATCKSTAARADRLTLCRADRPGLAGADRPSARLPAIPTGGDFFGKITSGICPGADQRPHRRRPRPRASWRLLVRPARQTCRGPYGPVRLAAAAERDRPGLSADCTAETRQEPDALRHLLIRPQNRNESELRAHKGSVPRTCSRLPVKSAPSIGTGLGYVSHELTCVPVPQPVVCSAVWSSARQHPAARRRTSAPTGRRAPASPGTGAPSVAGGRQTPPGTRPRDGRLRGAAPHCPRGPGDFLVRYRLPSGLRGPPQRSPHCDLPAARTTGGPGS